MSAMHAERDNALFEVTQRSHAYPFQKFVEEQPVDRIINHSIGWSNCAVGDYLHEALGYDYQDVLSLVLLKTPTCSR